MKKFERIKKYMQFKYKVKIKADHSWINQVLVS